MGRDAESRKRRTLCHDFNPRARVGRDLHHLVARGTIDISIHAPAWGATHKMVAILRELRISIHAPAWGATSLHSPILSDLLISIHAPAWGATLNHFCFSVVNIFQSTRPRGARQPRRFDRSSSLDISIHAPAWGATILKPFSNKASLISIHAPAWGATTFWISPSRQHRHFNPRARVGRDVHRRLCKILYPHFNPRTRVGRDMRCGFGQGCLTNFNPRARVGRDYTAKLPMSVSAYFNPRARVGRDVSHCVRGWLSRNFNPRARVGRDDPTNNPAPWHTISIHAPVWGATAGGV